MANEIIPYHEMCRRELASLQRGMNFELATGRSVILMSLRRNAPYRDQIGDDGTTLVYEGHDAPRSDLDPDPKVVDQPESSPGGALTENGKFYRAAQLYKEGQGPPHAVHVYEKIHQGVWSYNGLFHLVDAWRERDERRVVFKSLKLVAAPDEGASPGRRRRWQERRRIIPTEVKVEVWSRDKGRCRICGATDELHFDHVLPYSKGGTSLTAANVQLLCARHNLAKGAKIV